MSNPTTPPELRSDTDGTDDAALLSAISQNAECAHILAEIASGGDPRELLASFLAEDSAVADEAPEPLPEPQPEPEQEPQPEPAMYRSPLQQPAAPAPESCPTFLSSQTDDFWANW